MYAKPRYTLSAFFDYYNFCCCCKNKPYITKLKKIMTVRRPHRSFFLS